MTRKRRVLWVVALLALLGAVVVLVSFPGDPTEPTHDERNSLPEKRHSVQSVEEAPSRTPLQSGFDANEKDAGRKRSISGRVIDAMTGEPIQGARLILTEAHRIDTNPPPGGARKLPSAKSLNPHVLQYVLTDPEGRQSMVFVYRAIQADGRRLSVAWPDVESGPHAVSNAEGEFTLETRAGYVSLLCRHLGYVPREVLPSRDAWSGMEIELSRGIAFIGVVVGKGGAPVSGVPLEFAGLTAAGTRAGWRQRGTSDSSGRIEVTVVDTPWGVRCVSTDWYVTHVKVSSEENLSARITVATVPKLRVVARDTGSRVPRFGYILRYPDGPVESSGCVEQGTRDVSMDGWARKFGGEDGVQLLVWAPGYLPNGATILRVRPERLTTITLTPGLAGTLTGRVQKGGSPCVGAAMELRLLPATWKMGWWQLDQTQVVERGKTDAQGRFKFWAPPGPYAVSAEVEDVTYANKVKVMEYEQFTMDIAEYATLMVTVHPPSGGTGQGWRAVVTSSTGQIHSRMCDRRGAVMLTAVFPGEMKVLAYPPMGSQPLRAKISAAPGAVVTVSVPDDHEVRYPTIADASARAPWSARVPDGAWVAVQASGRVPIDMSRGGKVELRDCSGAVYSVRFPADPRPEELRVTLGSEGVRGCLLGQDGRPVAGRTVKIVPGRGRRIQRRTLVAVCETGPGGRFAIGGLADRRQYWIKTAPWCYFVPDYQSDAEMMTLTEPRVPNWSPSRGHIVSAQTGAGLAGVTVTFYSVSKQAGGEWRMTDPKALAKSDARGQVRVSVPDGDDILVLVHVPGRDAQWVIPSKRGEQWLITVDP